MKKTLYLKFLASYLLLGGIILCIIYFFAEPRLRANEITREANNLYRQARMVSHNYASAAFDTAYSAHQSQTSIETLASYNQSNILVIDTEGDLLIDSSDSEVLDDALEENYHEMKAFDVTDFGNKTYRVSDLDGTFSEDQLLVYSTITVDYKIVGYVCIAKSSSTISSQVNSYINIIYTAFAIVYACSFLILLCFHFLVYAPLRNINKTAESFAKGDFTAKTRAHSQDEIGYLANTLNYMADALDSQEEDQRKFISNVSHDFRSPLTSIKGYVEAILDGTIPVEMQDKYLTIILNETERLNKLTTSLLDLNNFGRHDLRLDKSDFDLNAIIKETVLSFEGTCQKKGISFDLVLTEERLFVTADMSKIQQVLYNLIDNAIKFSHHDGSIKIETSIKKEKVLVSVKDYGIGIPEDSIKKIWDRFYKTDLSRGKDKKGTGLGLSIVKEIITAHKQNINVISTEGGGTEFIFTLPLATSK